MTTIRPRVLQKGRLMPALETRLNELYDVQGLWQHSDAADFLDAHGGEFSALVTSANVGADAQLIDKLPQLRVISSFGVGIDKIDLHAAKRKGVAVGYTPDVLNDCVADLAIGMLIDVARGISAAERFVRRGDWQRGSYPLTTRVSGKRLGVFGLGRIGRAIAKRATGFDMSVRYTNRSPVAGAGYAFEPSLVELARWCDFLVVAAAGGASTRHQVSAAVLEALGPDGYVVNVSRGTVIDEAALVDALMQRRIAGAALDVFEHEPQVPAALLALDHVVLLPHIASGTRETRQAMADLVLANLAGFYADGKLVTPAPMLA
jgi:hydroxypyruvate reductase